MRTAQEVFDEQSLKCLNDVELEISKHLKSESSNTFIIYDTTKLNKIAISELRRLGYEVTENTTSQYNESYVNKGKISWVKSVYNDNRQG